MKLAIEILYSPYNLAGDPPYMWGEGGWVQTTSTDPANPDFMVFSNGAYCMEYVKYSVVPNAFGYPIRIVYLPSFTTTTNPGTTLSPRPGTLQFGTRDSSYPQGSTVYTSTGVYSYSDYNSAKAVSQTNYGIAIEDCLSTPGAFPDIIIFYS
jgi:hypothetical protein